jgi:hypothetical protein
MTYIPFTDKEDLMDTGKGKIAVLNNDTAKACGDSNGEAEKAMLDLLGAIAGKAEEEGFFDVCGVMAGAFDLSDDQANMLRLETAINALNDFSFSGPVGLSSEDYVLVMNILNKAVSDLVDAGVGADLVNED